MTFQARQPGWVKSFVKLYQQRKDFKKKGEIKQTGSTALDYIQTRLVDEAKAKIFETNKSINELAFQPGFKYQQHFTRLFKQKTGMTPNEYKKLN